MTDNGSEDSPPTFVVKLYQDDPLSCWHGRLEQEQDDPLLCWHGRLENDQGDRLAEVTAPRLWAVWDALAAVLAQQLDQEE